MFGGVVFSKLLIKYFCDTIDSFWLQDNIVGSIILGKVIPSKNSDRTGYKKLAIILFRQIEGVRRTINIDIICQLWVFFA